MAELEFIKNYKDNLQLRNSFFELSNSVFGLNFKSWYEQGYWKERYIPFSFVDNNKVVANVSVNIIDLIIDGNRHRAMQIGTVMTHPDYRNKGLSKELMNKVLAEYANMYDFMYLFANQSVLDFYPKFGFKIVEQCQYSTSFISHIKHNNELRKLDITNVDDLHLIHTFASERIPVSERFATASSQGILMYYCLNVFSDNIYYLESEDVIVIFNKEDNNINIFDIISKYKVNIHNILKGISQEGTNKIIFFYTPDYEGLVFERGSIKDAGTLFVKTNGHNSFPEQVKYPITAEA